MHIFAPYCIVIALQFIRKITLPNYLHSSFALQTQQEGVDLNTLADLMGHKDTRVTRRYAHIVRNTLPPQSVRM